MRISSAALSVAICTAVSGSNPASMARRTRWSRWPSLMRMFGWMSSVQSTRRRVSSPSRSVAATISGHSSAGSRSMRGVSSTRAPRRSCSTTSAGDSATWVSSTPATSVASRTAPRKPGSWPPTVLSRSMVASIFCSCARSAPSSSAGLMSPPMHTASGRSSIASVSAMSMAWPEVSRSAGMAGTRPGTRRSRFSGRRAASSVSRSTPATPSTLAISWGSSQTESTPRGTMARANSVTVMLELSRCMCGSMRPGTTNRPPASMISVSCPTSCSLLSPTAAIRPAAITTSAATISRVKTLTTRAPVSRASAGSSPSATRISRVRTSVPIARTCAVIRRQYQPDPSPSSPTDRVSGGGHYRGRLLGRCPSGQREQAVNLPATPSEVRILPGPPRRTELRTPPWRATSAAFAPPIGLSSGVGME